MKKILILLLVLSVILGTAACGAASKEPEATPVPETEAPVPADMLPYLQMDEVRRRAQSPKTAGNML